MAHKLADELIKVILSPPLLVPDCVFANTGPESPFTKVDHSASDVLRVCKRWMRVGTPSLYETVILRSMPQAKALALALKSNTEFGKYIKKLRIEGAYGENIFKIINYSPNIIDFCCTLSIYADTSVSGLVNSLTRLNPRRVLLTLSSPRRLSNANIDKFVAALSGQILRWHRLTTFAFSSTESCVRCDYERYPCLLAALAESTSVQRVTLALSYYYIDRCLAAVKQVLRDTNRLTVDVCSNVKGSRRDEEFIRQLKSLPAQLSSRVRLHGLVIDATALNGALIAPRSIQHSSLSDSHNPFFAPFAHASLDVRVAILSRILRFAVQRDLDTHPHGQHEVWYDISRLDRVTARNLESAFSAFKLLLRPILARHMFAQSSVQLQLVCEAVRLDARCASAAKTLVLHTYDVHGRPVLTSEAALNLLGQLQWLSNVSISLDHTILAGLARNCGSRLTTLELSVSRRPESWPSCLLFEFPALHKLVIRSIGFWAPGSEPTVPPLINAPLEHCLQVIEVDHRCAGFLTILSRSALPQLVTFVLRGTGDTKRSHSRHSFGFGHSASLRDSVATPIIDSFLAVRGHTLTEFVARETALPTSVLANGHMLMCVTVGGWWDALRSLLMTSAHTNLHKIEICFYSDIAQQPKAQQQQDWTALCAAVDKSRLPALEMIQVMDHPGDLWPASERETKRCFWPSLAERLQAQDITLLNRHGRAWRARVR